MHWGMLGVHRYGKEFWRNRSFINTFMGFISNASSNATFLLQHKLYYKPPSLMSKRPHGIFKRLLLLL